MAWVSILNSAAGNRDAVAASDQAGIPALAVRSDSDATITEANNDLALLRVDNAGRLKVVSAPQLVTAVTGNITASGQNVSADVSRASNVVLYCTGTFAGINVTFEASIDGGTNWFGVSATRSNANTVETTSGVLGSAPGYAWEISVNAYTNVRVRSTAWTSGTQSWRILPGTYATEPAPAIQTHAVTQSGTWNIGTVTPGTGATNLGKAEDAVHASGDIGVMSLSVRNDDAITTLTSATGDYAPLATDLKGALFTREKPSTSASVSNVTASTSSVAILPLNTTRRGALVFNDSTATLFLKFGATASTTSYTVKVPPSGFYEVPYVYTGALDGIWDAANGSARVTEVS